MARRRVGVGDVGRVVTTDLVSEKLVWRKGGGEVTVS